MIQKLANYTLYQMMHHWSKVQMLKLGWKSVMGALELWIIHIVHRTKTYLNFALQPFLYCSVNGPYTWIVHI